MQMIYVDGFIVPVPKKKLAAYRKIAKHRRQGLDGAWRAQLRRMRRRRRQEGQVDLVSAAASS